jgi:PIN domain nuclease of toxin-antitoxin system
MNAPAAHDSRRLALDSSAVLRWVFQEQRWHVIQRVIDGPNVDLILPGPVLIEVINLAQLKGNVSAPSHLRTTLASAGMRVEPATADDMQFAGELLIMSRGNPEIRAGTKHTLSLGDSLVLAVTARLASPIVTGDRHWTYLANRGLLPVTVHQI